MSIDPENVSVAWQRPGWPWVDPVKDANAAKLKLQMSVTTRRAICAEMGVDFDEVVDELKREDKQLSWLIPTEGVSNAAER